VVRIVVLGDCGIIMRVMGTVRVYGFVWIHGVIVVMGMYFVNCGGGWVALC